MKNNALDDIVKCNIEISNPGTSDVSFDNILLVVPQPKKGQHKMKKTTAISKADELLDLGFAVDDVAYFAANVAFSQNPSPAKLYVYARKVTSGQGIEPKVYEKMSVALTTASEEANFYGLHITDFREKEDIEAAMSWVESHEKIFGFEYLDAEKFVVKNTNFFRTFADFSGLAEGFEKDEQPEENKYEALAKMAKCFGYDPGTETWAMKELATIVPSVLTTELKGQLKEKNINTFLRYAGTNITLGGNMLAGEWIDVIRFRDWVKNEMQIRVFNALKVNRKVPYTDSGIGMIEGIMESVLKDGQDIGGIARNSYDKDGNEILGFEVFVPKASDFTEAERKQRVLKGCRWKARLAGAIHLVQIEGFLSF